MSAPSADERATALRPAIQSEFSPIITPLHWDAWHDELQAANCLDEFGDVPIGICDGFRIDVTSHLTVSYFSPNHKSA
ncbi:hypothetical protein BKA93DRAFT_727521 [Sparassis latifolia]